MHTAADRWRVLTRPPFPYNRSTIGVALSAFWLVGGITTLLVLSLPHPAGLHTRTLLAIGLVAPLVAAVTAALRTWLPLWCYPLMVAFGTVLVRTAMAAAGSPSLTVSFSFFLLWVVVVSLLFFSLPVALAEVALAAYAYASVVVGQRHGVTAAQTVALTAVVGSTGLAVLLLSRAREESEVDALTRLPNRRGLDRVLNEAMRGARSPGKPLVVAVLDVDHFKHINDAGGHHAGDRFLQAAAHRWRAVLRTGDVVGRYGGDEFLVILPNCAPDTAQGVLERMRQATVATATCSLGAAIWTAEDSASMLVSRADTALYEAKRQGRDRLVWADAPSRPAVDLTSEAGRRGAAPSRRA